MVRSVSPAAGDTERTIRIDLFAPTQPGNYTNQALIDPNNEVAENDETNNSDSTTTAVSISGGGNYIDLKINDITDSTDTPSPNQTYTYTIKAENTGTDAAFNVVVRDFLPTGVTFVQATGTHDFVCSESNGIVDCTGTLDGSLNQAPDSDPIETITIKVKAPKQHQPDTPYTNQVRIDPQNTVPEANETNNTATEDTSVTSKVDLTTEISLGSLSSGSEGDMTFGVSASFGSGATDAVDAPRGFVVIAELPIGVIPLDVAPPAGWTCQVEQNPVNKVTCIGDLTTGTTSASFTVHVYVTAQGEDITATAHADPAGQIVETDENNNVSSDSTGV